MYVLVSDQGYLVSASVEELYAKWELIKEYCEWGATYQAEEFELFGVDLDTPTKVIAEEKVRLKKWRLVEEL